MGGCIDGVGREGSGKLSWVVTQVETGRMGKIMWAERVPGRGNSTWRSLKWETAQNVGKQHKMFTGGYKTDRSLRGSQSSYHTAFSITRKLILLFLNNSEIFF